MIEQRVSAEGDVRLVMLVDDEPRQAEAEIKRRGTIAPRAIRLRQGAVDIRSHGPASAGNRRCRHGGRGALGKRPPPVFLDANGYRLVARAVKAGEYRGGRGERHFVLTRSTAVEDSDADATHTNRITGVPAIVSST